MYQNDLEVVVCSEGPQQLGDGGLGQEGPEARHAPAPGGMAHDHTQICCYHGSSHVQQNHNVLVTRHSIGIPDKRREGGREGREGGVYGP